MRHLPKSFVLFVVYSQLTFKRIKLSFDIFFQSLEFFTVIFAFLINRWHHCALRKQQISVPRGFDFCFFNFLNLEFPICEKLGSSFYHAQSSVWINSIAWTRVTRAHEYFCVQSKTKVVFSLLCLLFLAAV